MIILELLDPVGKPADHTSHRKNRREEIRIDP